jgi:hypothetical protein
MKLSLATVLIAALVISGTLLSGCILIPVAGFGYTGYQYKEKEGVFAPGQPLGGPGPAGQNNPNDKSSNSSSKPSPETDNSIE